MIEDAGHTETDPGTPTPLITLASCPVDSRPDGAPRLWGKLRIRIRRGTRAHEAYGVTRAEESFTCNYELNPEYREALERSGLIVSGVSSDGGARIIELPLYWFVGTGFLPQLNSAPGKPHPLIVSYLKAALASKKLRTKGPDRPETLESRWDILYRDYPEVYEEFAGVPSSRSWLDVVRRVTSLRGKTVADVGAGTGTSTFEIARYAGKVIGIEPEDAMRKIAEDKAAGSDIGNVSFIKGRADQIPLENASADIVLAVTAAAFHNRESVSKFFAEASRVIRPGGRILAVESAPGWYGGELSHVILGTRVGGIEMWKDRAFSDLGFLHRDFFTVRDYGTVDKAIATYGFIFGSKAIEYLRSQSKSTVKFKGRIYHRQV